MQFTASQQLLILHAGETGNAEEVAYEIQSKLLVASLVRPVDHYNVTNLPEEKYVVIVASTTGDGDVPESMKRFWNFLLRKSLSADSLTGLSFSVFGLGDSSYDKFNAVARKLDKRLSMLGAMTMSPLGLGDDQAPYGYLSALNSWLADLALKVSKAADIQPLSSCNVVHQYNYKIVSSETCRSMPLVAMPAVESEVYATTVVANQRLTASVWGQDVRHLKLHFNKNIIEVGKTLYEVGDVAAIYYTNPPELVNKAISLIVEGNLRTGESIMPDSILNIEVSGVRRPSRLSAITNCSLYSLLERHLDIGAVPKRSYFAALAPFATNPEEAAKLLEIASDAGTDLYFDYCTKERKNYVEVLEEFRSCRPPLQVLLGAIQIIPARQYSIASSPALCPREVELCVAVSQRTTPYGRKRTGLCSGFISRLAVGDLVHVSLKPGSIRTTPLCSKIPADAGAGVGTSDSVVSPLVRSILIGPGTGVAPMRSLIQHEIARQLLESRDSAYGINSSSPPSSSPVPVPHALLFFGCRKQQRDYLYGPDWADINSGRNPYLPEAGYALSLPAHMHTSHGRLSDLQQGSIVVSAAFSQDQLVKDYVTHKIKACGSQVCAMLQQGACVFVAGSSKRMPADVRKALCAALEEHAGLSPEESDAFLLRLARGKKYIVEAWS